ncbi:MAG TPA: FAD-dependent oxidoreductase, partial [Thermoplasmata archaeon]|nr:FAD-dependent oxidoreductase [Thermoplasmata archaeon]
MEKFEAIVVGAGPAGSATAYGLAKAGVKTLLVERGKAPGQKAMFGGRIYSYPLHALIPDFAKDCPVERYITRENMSFLADDTALNVTFDAPKLGGGLAASFTAYRGKFDAWLAKKAEEAGAMLITGIRVDKVYREGGKVAGVEADGDIVKADVVVAADGALSQLARTAGLRGEPRPEEYSVGVKETIELPQKVLEERFNLDEKEGAAYVFAGAASGGLRGGGFLYTNKASLSLGLVVSSEDLAVTKTEIGPVMDRFRRHPSIARLVKGGKVLEWSAHLVPELGRAMSPRTYDDGLLLAGDAAGFLLNTGYTFRGVDLAIASGMAAADAIVQSRDAGGYSAANLAVYERLLRERQVTTDLETFSRAPFYLKNP